MGLLFAPRIPAKKRDDPKNGIGRHESFGESQPFSRQGLSFLHLMLFSVSLKGWHICRRCETHQRRSGAWGQGVEMLIQILGTVTIQKHPRSLGPTLNASSLNKKNHRRGLSNKITLSFFFCITTVWPCDFSRTTHTRQKTRRSQKWHWKA